MIAVIVPTLNEEKAIRDVINAFPDSYRDNEIECFVIDGGSSDSTREEAREAGATVIEQKLDGGKGNGVREALKTIEADFYVMIDGDGTYDPREVGKLLDPLLDREAEHVIGWRNNRDKGAIPLFNRAGNRIFNIIASVTTGRQVHDMLSGYRAFTRDSLRHTDFTRPGFGIETEMTFTSLENNLPVKEVEISYSNRKGESKLHPLKDGWRIFNTIVWSIRDMNPLKFFSSISLLIIILGLYPAYLTVAQKIITGRVRDLGPPIAAGVLLILAVQFFILGMISDQLKNFENRMRYRFEE